MSRAARQRQRRQAADRQRRCRARALLGLRTFDLVLPEDDVAALLVAEGYITLAESTDFESVRRAFEAYAIDTLRASVTREHTDGGESAMMSSPERVDQRA
ncbi:hypothetical protein FHP25_13325 [Vineibacter terrae]|uniref:Uncharacterized protein n=1 Tax=Vineibacter terrae TaxID=2586908 RepID=A0A5C8PMK2_9HYPH|nr:hypothetical protein [Vineibacter terrae]TXL75630.1 hypothetical protein FHP25_13325 [Vineibacter terrae]